MFRVSHSLRWMLILLVLVAVVPAATLAVAVTIEARQRETAHLEQDVLQWARLVSLEEKQLILGTRQLLKSMASSPEVRACDPEECSARLSALLSQYARYANLGAAKPDGNVCCSALPSTSTVNIADRAYFQRAVQTRDFSVGDYQVGHISGKPSVNLGYPLLDAEGQVEAVLFAALDLDWLNSAEFEVESQFPEGTVLIKVDCEGRILVHDPDPEKWVGQSLAGRPLMASILSEGTGVVEASDMDGVARLYAFASVRSELYGADMYVIIGVPRATLFAKAEHTMTRSLAALSLVGLVALAAAWGGGEVLIRRPVEALVQAADRLGRGDLSARTGIPSVAGEIGQLARVFDRMAEALGGRQTQRELAEQALRASEEEFRTLFDSASDAIFIHGFDGQIWEANLVACERLGYTHQDLLQMTVTDIDTPEFVPLVPERLAKLRQDGRAVFETAHVRHDGSVVPVEVSSRLVNFRGQSAVLSIARDITERKRAEADREKMRAQLLQAQKMEAIGSLAGGIAHDFNNLLTAIQGRSELALSELSVTDPAHAELLQVQAAATRAASLTRQLLLFSRKEPVERTQLSLNYSVEAVVKMLKHLIGEHIAISTHLYPDLWSVQADPGRIEQVLMNLTINARDAMPRGGALIVTTENVILDQSDCSADPLARPGRFVRLTVEDTGVGMDAATLQRIFEPFFTTKRQGEGTGLGLAVVYGIVSEHGGWIKVHSELGRGSTLCVYLPASSVPGKQVGAETATYQNLGGKGERLLLAEDEEIVRAFAAQALVQNGYAVSAAGTVHEALQIFEREKGQFDLLISDALMPDGTGLELVDQLLSLAPRLRILLCSGHPDERSQWTAIRDRGFRFLQKPYGVTDLLRAVRETLETKALNHDVAPSQGDA